MAEYTIKDVIIDPEDPRVEVGKKYYYADGPADVVSMANNSGYVHFGILNEIDQERSCPFRFDRGPYSCIIRKKKALYAECQAKWIADNDIKKGDKVRIARKADTNEDGWRNRWTPDMDEAVGKVGTVSHISTNFVGLGIEVDVPGVEHFMYPYFVLEKVEPEYEPYDFSDLACRASLLGKAVRFADGSRIGPALITGFELFDDGTWGVHVGGVSTMDAVALLDGWVFSDGTPCGVVAEDKEERP